jgi:Cytochrome c oxidase biogenesis protein Cmc1 like
MRAHAAACLYKLKQHALKIKCEEQARAYAECCNGRSFSMVWACKPMLNDLNACLKQRCRQCSDVLHIFASAMAQSGVHMPSVAIAISNSVFTEKFSSVA